jgi:plasmid maintenance system antidote protein VapI
MGPSTQVSETQRPRGPLREIQKPKKVEGALLSTCDSMLDAIHLCIHLSRLPHYVIAENLGVDKGHWTRMMQGQAHFPTNKMKTLMDVCGNYAPIQWLAAQTGFELFEDARTKRKDELRRELEQLETAA